MLGVTEQGRQASAPSGSSYGLTKDGLSGIYAVMEGQRVARRWTLPLDRLDDQVGRIVIWDVYSIDEAQMSALQQWVNEGGVALVGGPLEPLAQSFMDTKAGTARSVAAHPVTLNIDQIDVGLGRFAGGEGRLVHLQDETGAPVLISWPHGRGRIYWSADTEWLTNDRIANGQNLELALQILLPQDGRQVAFDEYHHGFQSAGKWWQILRGQLQAFVLMLCAAVVLLFWAYGARFGSPRPTPPGPPRAAVEYVYSMSQLYRRAQARRMVLQTLYRSLTVELGRLLGGTHGLTHAQIAERTAHRAGVSPVVIESLLDRIHPEQKAVPSEAELIRLARESEDLQRRMRNAGFRDQRQAGEGSR